MRRKITLKNLVLGTTAVILVAAPLLVRARIESHDAFKLGRIALAKGDHSGAIEHFRRSVSWNFIGNSAASQSIDELWKLSQDPNVSIEVRIAALEDLKSGARTSRSILTPQRYEDSNSIAGRSRLALAELTPETKPALIDLSQKDPNYFWQISANFFWYAWLTSVVAFIWRGFGKDGSITWSRLALPFACGCAAYVLWITSLIFA